MVTSKKLRGANTDSSGLFGCAQKKLWGVTFGLAGFYFGGQDCEQSPVLPCGEGCREQSVVQPAQKSVGCRLCVLWFRFGDAGA